MRKSYVWDKEKQELVEAQEYWASRQKDDHHYIIQDTMAPTEHPVTGEVFESKSAFRAVTKAHGLYERGNDLISKELPKLAKEKAQWVAENRRKGLEQAYKLAREMHNS